MRSLARAVLASVLPCLPITAQATGAEIVRGFAPFDLDGDGRAEVRSLELLEEAGDAGKPLVVVLVEARVLATEPGGAEPTLRAPLKQFANDIAADGCHVLLVAAEVHSGPPHQDGRTVLAIRRLCQRLRAVTPMAGVVLVGHFPDALLVRTCNWRRTENLSLPGKDGQPIAFDGSKTNVRCVPEIVAHRCDVVLADLDGDWERVYVPGPTTLVAATAVFGDTVPSAGGPCVGLATSEVAVTDVFHVRDGAAIADAAGFALHLDADDRDHECSASDRALGNPLAQPEIAVSRIDARGVALQFVNDAWQPDAAFERALLASYLQRNHRFRSEGVPADHHLPASIAHGLGSGMGIVRAADPAWADFAAPGYDVGEGADLVALAEWLQRPAVLRTLRAHSDPWCAAFAATDPAALTKAIGEPLHRMKRGEQWVATWADHRNGRADYAFYRAFERSHRDGPRNPFLLIHTGCEAVSPPGAVELPYDDPGYGRFAHADSILFFTDCVAMVGRAKVFYDEPAEFVATLANGGTFGDAWRRYFAVEAAAGDWDRAGGDIGRKRSYFWSLVGDWTLRLPKIRP